METIVSLCKRRGFIFPGSEIYGGLQGTYDYGPLGAALKRNVREAWLRAMVHERDDMELLDASILMNPRVWEASGHVACFSDPMCDCLLTKKRYRADHVEEEEGLQVFPFAEFDQEKREMGERAGEILAVSKGEAKKLLAKYAEDFHPGKRFMPMEPEGEPFAGKRSAYGGHLTPPRDFNLMFQTHAGPVADESSAVYLRPETAQGIFVNYENVRSSMRRKLPFGIAQIGKSFRNEITPRNFIFRVREFEQMEIEFFCHPTEAAKKLGVRSDEEWHEYWISERHDWYVRFGIRPGNLAIRPHATDELAHYAKGCVDVEYEFPSIGYQELEGIANRTDYDLRQHMDHSGKKLDYFDEALGERYIPYVIEPSAGVDRGALAFLCDAYHEEEVRGEKRTVLKFHPAMAPLKAAVLPLARNQPEIVEKARALTADLKKRFAASYDDTAGIGKLYRRQDEIGTPVCFTVDHDTLTDGQVTARDRDTMEQVRIPMEKAVDYLADMMAAADKA